MIHKIFLTCAAMIMITMCGMNASATPITVAQGQSVALTFQSTQFAGSNATALISLNGNQLTLLLTNTSTNDAFLSGIGFNTTPNLDVRRAAFSGAALGWSFGTTGGGLGGYEMRVFGNGNAVRLQDGQTGNVVLTLTSMPASITFDEIVAHLTSLPNGNSEKPVGSSTSPVPEPATLLLFGTGVAGIAARLRKRHKAGLTAAGIC